LEIGSLTYAPINVMLCNYDGDTIYSELEAKLKSGQDLTDADMLNLMFLPLMKNSVPKNELAAKSIELAQTIRNETKRDACIASAIAFMSKYLNDDEINNILGVLKMTDIVTRIISDDRLEIAKRMLAKNKPIEEIAEFTDIPIETVEALQEELESEETDE